MSHLDQSSPLSEAQTLADVFYLQSLKLPDSPFLSSCSLTAESLSPTNPSSLPSDEGAASVWMSYAEFFHLSSIYGNMISYMLAATCAATSLSPSQPRIAILAENSIELLLVITACWIIDLTPVPISFKLPTADI